MKGKHFMAWALILALLLASLAMVVSENGDDIVPEDEGFEEGGQIGGDAGTDAKYKPAESPCGQTLPAPTWADGRNMATRRTIRSRHDRPRHFFYDRPPADGS